MLPRRRLAHSRGLPFLSITAHHLVMSESNTHQQSVGHGDQVYGDFGQYTNKRVIEDRRWISSQRIKFQQPSLLGHSHYSTLSSQNGLENANLNLRATGRLSYPDLSVSSFATASDIPVPIASPSSSDGQTCSIQTAPSPANIATPSINISASDEPFRSPRGFHIPKSKLENALLSRPGSAASFWQYTLYEGPDTERQKVTLHYCKNKERTEAVSQMFLDEDVIGFDIEWMAQAKSTDGIKKNVALIQIASEERIALFHIARYPGPETAENLVSPTLKNILESPNTSKVGVAVKGDSTRLRNFLGIHCQGLFELSHLHKLVQYRSGHIDKVDRRFVRLADQVKEHLQLPLYKGGVQTSDWSRDLDYKQTQYAASDSYAGLQLFHVLEAKRKTLNPVPPRPAHAELDVAISLGDSGQNNHQVEQREDEEDFDNTQAISSTGISMEELAREYFHVSLVDDVQNISKAFDESPSSSNGVQPLLSIPVLLASELSAKSKDGIPSTEGINSPELQIANQFVATFKPPENRRVAPQALRAYSLWHNQGLTIPEVAARLRKPPIRHSTVISYLCDAICLGNLEYEPVKVLEFSSQRSWRPFIKAHRDLFDRAREKDTKSKGFKCRGRFTSVRRKRSWNGELK